MPGGNEDGGGSVVANGGNKTRRLVVGIFILLLVDVLWVASSELTEFIFKKENFARPFFSTYLKTCMFTIYLLGFMFHRPWRDQCLHPLPPEFEDEGVGRQSEEDSFVPMQRVLSAPEFEPILSCSDNDSAAEPAPPDPEQRNVRFAGVHEVRTMPESEATSARVSRMPYELWLRTQRIVEARSSKLSIRKVAKLALHFCFIWFVGNLAYQEALNLTEPGVVNVLSSTAALFTLILAAVFPSCASDRFTLTKLCLVASCIGGTAVVTWVDSGTVELGVPVGVIWAMVGALAYAAYLVFLRRTVDSEEKLEIPMFFGFVGLFCLVFLWPGMYFLHATNVESFYPLPNRTQIMYLTINGLVGTVLSEYLWLWGCFLTSSLIATFSLSLVAPLTIVADSVLGRKPYAWPLLAGTVPIMLAFVGASLVTHYDNYDPVAVGLKKCVQKVLYISCLLLKCCRRSSPVRLRDVDREQTESLIESEHQA